MTERLIDVTALATQAGVRLDDDERESVSAVVSSIVSAFGVLELGDVPEDTSLDARWR